MFDILDTYQWLYPILAFLAVVILIPPFIKLAPLLKLVDEPGGRKQHEGAIPLIGGLMIFPVFIAMAMLAGFSWNTHWPFYSAILLLLLTGAVDDRVQLHAWLKFFIQFCAAGLIIFPGGAQLFQLGDLFGLGKVGLDFMAIPFTFAAVVLLINAVNLMDGLDGLASGYSAMALSWLAIGFYIVGYPAGFLIIALLIGCICGFLVYNMRSPIRKKSEHFSWGRGQYVPWALYCVVCDLCDQGAGPCSGSNECCVDFGDSDYGHMRTI